jgi:hypothetical protein
VGTRVVGYSQGEGGGGLQFHRSTRLLFYTMLRRLPLFLQRYSNSIEIRSLSDCLETLKNKDSNLFNISSISPTLTPLTINQIYYSILFYSILFNFIQFYSILAYSILFYYIIFYYIILYSILFYYIIFYSRLFFLTTSKRS